MKQRTLARAVSIKGTGLHTGNPVQLTFKPAPANHGLVFKRLDLNGQPEVHPRIESWVTWCATPLSKKDIRRSTLLNTC